MRNPLRRHYGQGELHFVTFSCYRRRPYLATMRARNYFVKILEQVRRAYRFRLVGYVVMPEHVHLLLEEPKKGNPSKVLQVLKQKIARGLRRERKHRPANHLELSFGEDFGEAQHFWQRRFYDFNVWSEKKQKEKLEYMHANPLQRKLVGHPRDWPWSSWCHYAKGEPGLITIDSLDNWKTGKTRTLENQRVRHPL